MAFQFDDKDQAIADRRQAQRDQFDGPRMGDYVLFPTGELERFSHDWGDELQTSPSGAFHMYEGGDTQMTCGGLHPATPRDQLVLAEQSLPGTFWFFHHGEVGAGRGVYFRMPCRLYRTTAPYKGYLGADFQSADIQALKKQLDHQPGIDLRHQSAGAAA